MAWTYSGDPANSDRDWVRFRIGDTDTLDQQLQDAEIASLLTDFPPKGRAAAEACRRIAAKYARLVDTSTADKSDSLSQRQQHYRDLAGEIESEMASGVGSTTGPLVGGQTVAGKEANREDTSLVQPWARRDLLGMDNEDDPCR